MQQGNRSAGRGTVNLVVGGGQAGARAVQAMVAAGFEGRIELIGSERLAPYERPPLSKAQLAVSGDRRIKSLLPPNFASEHGVRLALGETAVEIDIRAGRLRTSTGRAIAYDRLLIATGARPRRLSVPGAERAGLLYLRTQGDSRRLRRRLRPGARILVVGGGLIGLEVAAAARARDCDVTVVEAAPRILARVLGPEVAACVQRAHQARGVRILTGAAPARIEAGAPAWLELTDGTRLAADAIVVGVGVQPCLELAADAGLAIGDGVLTDAECRASHPAIFAAGDVAARWDATLGRHVRSETWQNAQDEGFAAALAMADQPTPCIGATWAWSDQFGLDIQLAGHWSAGGDVVIRGVPESGSFMIFHLREGRVVGAQSVNRGPEMVLARRMIASRALVDPQELGEAGVILRTLIKTR